MLLLPDRLDQPVDGPEDVRAHDSQVPAAQHQHVRQDHRVVPEHDREAVAVVILMVMSERSRWETGVGG